MQSMRNCISEMDHANGGLAGIENGSSSSHGDEVEHADDVEEPAAAASESRYLYNVHVVLHDVY